MAGLRMGELRALLWKKDIDLGPKPSFKAKLQDVAFHTLRHTFCSSLCRLDVPCAWCKSSPDTPISK